MITPKGIKNISDARDFTDTTGPGADGHSMVWDDTTGKFILSEVTGVSDHGALTGLADDDHIQYLLADGSRTGASAAFQAFTSGITTGTIRPASDSATAIQIQNAAGTQSILTVSATNKWVGINGTPSKLLDLYQQQDTNGIRINGFDDRSAYSISLAVNSGGTGFFSTSHAMLFLATDGSMSFKSSTDDIYWQNASNQRIIVGDQSRNVAIQNSTPTAAMDLPASTTSFASLRIRSGTAPTSPNDGDIWYDGTDYLFRVGSSSYSAGTVTRTTAIRPLSDSTTALQLQNAAGTVASLTIDTTNDEVLVNNRLGVNDNPGSTERMVINSTAADSVGIYLTGQATTYGINTDINFAVSGSSATALRIAPTFTASANTSASYVLNTSFFIDGSADISNVYANYIFPRISSGATSTTANMYGIRIDTASDLSGGNGSITNMYGYMFSDQTLPTGNVRAVSLGQSSGTNKFNVFANGSAKNYFAGDVGLGTTSPTAFLDVAASTTAKASLRIRSGTAPTSPNDGDIWFDGTDLKIRASGATYTLTKA